VLCRDQLGRVFLEQERWDEATACFQEVIAESPKRGGGHRSMAELLLRLGGQDAVALDSARAAEALDRAEPVHPAPGGQEVHNSNLSESLAVLAWALARNRAESSLVESALSEAFAMSNGLAKAIVAELHFFAGHAYAAREDTDESLRHFQSATETDPDGNYGRLARSAARLHTAAN
jgi:tetratricopeptide (TPR) repeat protein